MSGWFLQQINIEGFRGINNEGVPLSVKLKPQKVNSISAPNGVGKTSIFDAILYAISGRIPKLETLPAAERGPSYYLNQFHNGDVGQIDLVLLPDDGGAAVTVTVTRDNDGVRAVAAPAGIDGNAILSELNREFVLLDGKTFQQFIDHKPLDRGKSFAGLLGLRRFSSVRSGLDKISHTRAFNNHFDVNSKTDAIATAKKAALRAGRFIKEAYQNLVGEELDSALGEADVLAKAHAALNNIELLKPFCEGKSFEQIDPAKCNAAAKAAEGGEDRERHGKILRLQTAWTEASASLPKGGEPQKLIELAKARDVALAETQGDQFRTLYDLSEKILSDEAWENEQECPVCDRSDEQSVLDHVREKISKFEAVGTASKALSEFWVSTDLANLEKLETLAVEDGETKLIEQCKTACRNGTVTEEKATAIADWIKLLSDRSAAKLKALAEEKAELEKKLPEKLTAVVEKVEAARRLQENLAEVRQQNAVITVRSAELDRIKRVKEFLDGTAKVFADAESRAADRRLKAIEPKCREFFAAIMFEDVTPALSKREGGEEIAISLSEFWSIKDVSAQALLSESFRNAFAISVYLAAASLYGGAAKFVVLDDVTSSFDSGHQLHLMNVIRDKFARPAIANGPQVILLSHDPALEKLFNKNSNEGAWWHQCIQGTPRTSVLPQSGAVNKIKDATHDLLDVGNTDDAAPRIRQYLEFKLEEVINKVKIPVPITIAFNDDKHMAGNLIDAIEKAVDLYAAAGKLILEPAQVASMNISVAVITGNYLTHWSTNQTHAFTAGALKGVMQAIDDFASCFQYEDPVGSGSYRYYKNLEDKH